MTHVTDRNANENVNEEAATEVEDESDAGSDIFMPGGITMKAAELPGEDPENPTKKTENTKTDEPCQNVENEDKIEEVQNMSIDEDEKPRIKKETLTEEDIKDNMDDDKSIGSPSSCLEINIDDESAFPRSKKEKRINSLKTEDEMKDANNEDRNIFMNSDLFQKEKDEKAKTEPHSDDEHNMSDDFKIGLNQPSYEEDPFCPDKPRAYETVETNVYLIDKKKSRSREDRYMRCECPFEPDDPNFVGCDEDCLNRLLMIECSPKNCPTGEFCTNRNFQRGSIYDLEVFKAGKKGWGLRTNEEIQKGSFIMEYCGEVVDNNEFQRRTQIYHDDGISHYYFMTLKQNEIIDATQKGSKSRFINHSCDPNCETQKWTVNGFLRVGFFAVHHIYPGEELSFDYQFQRYGDEPQECYCGADKCRGVIGSEQVSSIPTYFEKIMADSPSRSEKKKKKFNKSELAEELNECFGRTWELEDPKQALELLRLMVKVETTKERIVLLKILQVSRNSTALNAFIRYKGLTLLWSWMIDAPESKAKYKIEILKTLKHIPIPNRNELDDSKLETVIQKWASSKGEENANKKSSRTSSTDDNNSNTASGSDNEASKLEDGENSSQEEESSKEENTDREKLDKTCESVEEGEILDEVERNEAGCVSSSDRKSKKKKKKQKDDNDESKAARREEKILSLSIALMDDWKQLKEVFKIPKKSQTPDRRPRPEGELYSPLPSEEKKTAPNTPINRVTSSEASYSSPPVNSRFTSTRPNDESSESSNTDTKDDKQPRSPGSYRSRRRDWRKSPEIDRDKSNEDDKRGRWGRDRRNSFDRDRNRDRGGGRWNNDDRRGRDRNWNDRNSWNDRNRAAGSRYGVGRDANQIENRPTPNNTVVNDATNWNNTGVPHWTAPPRPPMQPPQPPHGLSIPPQQFSDPLLPPPMMNNDVSRPTGNFPGIMTPNQPTNMMQMNMLQNPTLMQPPVQPPNHLGVVMPPQPQKPMVPSPMSVSSQPFMPSVSLATSISAPPPQPPYNPSAPADVNTLNVVNQLLLLNAERLKQATSGGGSHSSTPDNSNSRTSAPASPHRNSAAGSPTRSKPISTLPAHWKTATDADGRVYYYHTLTRETSWDPPQGSVEDRSSSPKRTKKNNRDSSNYSPMRHSPRIAAADTTHKSGPRTPPSSSSLSNNRSADIQKIRDTFKSKISSVVVNCLNSYQKVDCKQGRIKSIDDFKFLARKLTHGLIMKERQRIGNEELLNCNDSVKLKVKEYIRNYMKKFGAVYIRS